MTSVMCDPPDVDALTRYGSAADALEAAGEALAAAHALADAVGVDDIVPEAMISIAQQVLNQADSFAVRMAGEGGVRRAAKLDGLASAGPWVAHKCRVPQQVGYQRVRVARLLSEMPELQAAFRAGLVGWEQLRALEYRVNDRNRAGIVALDVALAEEATELLHPEWVDHVRGIADLTDPEGAEQRDADAVENRHAGVTKTDRSTVRVSGELDAVKGSTFIQVFDQFEAREFQIDLAFARDHFGDTTTLPRTADQRRADALHAMALAAAEAAGLAVEAITVNVVMDDVTFDRESRILAGDDPGPDDPSRYRTYRCDVEGMQIAPSTAMDLALSGQIRRVVMVAPSVIIDLGRRSRLMHRQLGTALKAIIRRCQWPGCNRWARNTQLDHLTPHSEGGTSDGTNCTGHCGCHNRIKNRGYTTTRQPDGTIDYRRPDGTPIT